MADQTKLWQADKVSSNIGFAIKHFGFSKVRGRFDDYEASIALKNNEFETAKLTFEAEIKSINTFSSIRDKHLQSEAYFNAEGFPKLQFVSTEILKQNNDTFLVEGKLTFKGQTKTITLQATYGAIVQDPWGNSRFGLMMKTEINREEWNIKINDSIANGSLIVGKIVEIEIDLEMV